MSSSVIACPSCSTALFSAADRCPECGHEITAEERQILSKDAAPAPARLRKLEEPCPTCGEMVRVGAVRCWKCGNFMRADIAQKYREMQASPSPVIYSDLPETDENAALEEKIEYREADPFEAYLAEDADFELSPDIAVTDAGDDDFEVSDAGSHVEFDLPPVEESESATYGLQPAAPAEPETSGSPTPYEISFVDALEGAPDVNDPDPEEEGQKGRRALPPDPLVPHSVATGGDVLMRVAMQEESERPKTKRPRQASTPPERRRQVDGVLVFCPKGHRVVVKEEYRGRSGRCPKCKSPFVVPTATWEQPLPVETVAPEAAVAQAPAVPDAAPEPVAAQTYSVGEFTRWVMDVLLHPVDPTKLKLKAGSLKTEFELADVAFSPEQILVATIAKRSGFSGSINAKKATAAREAVAAHLREGKSAAEAPAVAVHLLTREHAPAIRIVQPTLYEHESIFAGVPVFGEGRIAVKLPQVEQSTPILCLSFTLSQFREFSEALRDFGFQDFGKDYGIPLTDEFKDYKCHYSDTKLHVLQQVGYYQADPAFELVLIGRQCQGCGLVVSEEARKKEKIGGPNGKAIARAKCPKCKAKFGDTSLFTLPGFAESAGMPTE